MKSKWLRIAHISMLVALTIFLCSCSKSTTESRIKLDVEENTSRIGLEGPLSPQADEVVFPSKSIYLVVPYAPGGGTDSIARAFARVAKKYLDYPIIIVNKVGEGGGRGMREGIFALNDGYTLTMVTSELNTLAVFDFIDFSYEDVDPLTLLNSEQGIVVVSKDSLVHTIDELIESARDSKKKYSIGSAGEGSVWHLAAKGIENSAQIQFDYKYYDGTSIALVDLLGGKTDIVIAGLSEVKAHIDAGEVKVLSVLSDSRLSEFPEVETFSEAGYDFSIGTWRGLGIPKHVDENIKGKLLDIAQKVSQDEEFIATLKVLNLNYDYKSKSEFETFIKADFNTLELLNQKLDAQR
ncbi:tripartite tricarboxylate transporter substrate binding protein [Fusibacter sp. 3D3]|uniref:tripartite tricarboxylate transporter substrate binding protein n=1 Tax=Fusibacter sp. 3D3 TaxID=1048380 RepID=UPI0008534994|nr:tripartite tricarboxylate transporter substrate binding protein [Fusibacter sp. 3D3]GAU75555.1 tricarboxylate transport protein TctC [Fusibacter sp. 3D3]